MRKSRYAEGGLVAKFGDHFSNFNVEKIRSEPGWKCHGTRQKIVGRWRKQALDNPLNLKPKDLITEINNVHVAQLPNSKNNEAENFNLGELYALGSEAFVLGVHKLQKYEKTERFITLKKDGSHLRLPLSVDKTNQCIQVDDEATAHASFRSHQELQPSDMIVSVNGIPLCNIPQSKWLGLVHMVGYPPGTEVSLSFYRKPEVTERVIENVAGIKKTPKRKLSAEPDEEESDYFSLDEPMGENARAEQPPPQKKLSAETDEEESDYFSLDEPMGENTRAEQPSPQASLLEPTEEAVYFSVDDPEEETAQTSAVMGRASDDKGEELNRKPDYVCQKCNRTFRVKRTHQTHSLWCLPPKGYSAKVVQFLMAKEKHGIEVSEEDELLLINKINENSPNCVKDNLKAGDYILSINGNPPNISELEYAFQSTAKRKPLRFEVLQKIQNPLLEPETEGGDVYFSLDGNAQRQQSYAQSSLQAPDTEGAIYFSMDDPEDEPLAQLQSPVQGGKHVALQKRKDPPSSRTPGSKSKKSRGPEMPLPATATVILIDPRPGGNTPVSLEEEKEEEDENTEAEAEEQAGMVLNENEMSQLNVERTTTNGWKRRSFNI